MADWVGCNWGCGVGFHSQAGAAVAWFQTGSLGQQPYLTVGMTRPGQCLRAAREYWGSCMRLALTLHCGTLQQEWHCTTAQTCR
jgi:hypothetical protein